MENCIFCKIAKHEAPAQIAYEDKKIIAFLDRSQYVKGHLMVIPKKHSRWLWDMETKDYKKLMEKCHYLANVLRKAFKTEWVEEIVAGIGVPHTHIHLLQRQKDDGIGEIPTKPLLPQPTEEERKQFIELIKQHL